jgi:hypothetical protein
MKQKSVKESRAESESEKKSIEREKTEHDVVVQAHSEDLLTIDQLLKDIQSELSVAKSLEDIVCQHFNGANAGAVGEDHVGNLDSDVLKYEAAVDEANRNRNMHSADAAIKISVRRCHPLKLGYLFSQKEDGCKAAGEALKEIKDALATKEQCEAELADESSCIFEREEVYCCRKRNGAWVETNAVMRDKIYDLRSILKDFDASTGQSA